MDTPPKKSTSPPEAPPQASLARSGSLAHGGPRDVFLYLLAIITLYLVSFSLGRLLFDYINLAFPDPLEYGYRSPDFSYDSIRWSIASLIIVFPAYFFVWRFLVRERLRSPEHQELRIRKWLIYLTLFLAAVVMMSDLVTLVFRLLGGEFTARFILKVLTVFAIAGTIFYAYLSELRNYLLHRLCIGAVIFVIVVSVVSGFFVIGSPAHRRLLRFDQERVSALQNVQSEILEYRRVKGNLPETLEALHDDIRGYIPPKDPETKQSYEYRVLEPFQFELCATFTTSTKEEATRSGTPKALALYRYPYDMEFGTWEHDKGRACFSRTIDPTRYPTDLQLKQMKPR